MKKAIYISLSLLLASLSGISQTKQLELNDKVPYFTLPNQDGKTFNMKDSIGTKMLVIFFYPKSDNKKEACAFSDSLSKFNEEGALVIGISENNTQKLKKFHDDNKLRFDLLSDPDKTVLRSFGVKENLLSDRITYIVNIAGEIVYKNYSLTDGKKHVAEALKYLRETK